MRKQIDQPIYKKLGKIENDIHDLKLIVLRNLKAEKGISIGGLLKNVKISDQEIKEARSSLFRADI